MKCPNCGNKKVAVVVYGYIEDENGNEYPFDPRVYEAGDSLPAWGINGKYNGYFYQDEDWPTRYCYECHTQFNYVPEEEAFNISYNEALLLAEKEWNEDIRKET